MPAAKRLVTDQVYEELFRMVLKGGYASGDKLPSENELRQQFNVSRNTIRAALNRMNVLGVVETRKGGGTYLKGFGTDMYLNTFVPSVLANAEDLMGLMVFRRGVEVSSARLAAVNATAQDLRSLEEYFGYLQRGDVSTREFAQSTSDFHLKIAVASKNDLLARTLEMIKWVITEKMADFLVYKPDVADSSYYHYMIFRCIRHRKPDEAAFMMDRHMTLLIDRVEDYIRHTRSHARDDSCEAHTPKTVTHIFDKSEETSDDETT